MHESAGVHFSFQSVQEAHLVVFSPEFPQVDEIFTPESATCRIASYIIGTGFFSASI